MKKNGIRENWAHGETDINGWLVLPDPFTAEIMAAQGFDSMTIDMQHGVYGFDKTVAILQALGGYDVTPIVRVPWLEPGIVMKVLDAGARGVICPMVNTREETEKLVSYVRFPPLGTRSFGPIRAATALGGDYFAKANDDIVCIAMIETQEAVDNLDAIVSTPGLDGIFIGPADLALSVSGGELPPVFENIGPEIQALMRRICDTAHDAGVKVCTILGSPEDTMTAMAWGFDLIALGFDAAYLGSAAKKNLDNLAALRKENGK